MIYYAQLYILICTLFMAGHDSTSYLLKSIVNAGPLVFNRIKRWHTDGAIIWCLCCLPVIYFVSWKLAIAALLIRLSVFDPAFNIWSGLPATLLGTTARLDIFFSKIFGRAGAIKKSLTFLLILIILNILNHLLKK